MLLKRITNFNNNFFKIEVYTPNFNHEKFEKVFEKVISGVKISYCRCSKWNHKVSFQHLKQNLISNSTFINTNSANLSSINLVNVINGNHDLNAPNLPIRISQNSISLSNTEKFSFCLSWNTKYQWMEFCKKS